MADLFIEGCQRGQRDLSINRSWLINRFKKSRYPVEARRSLVAPVKCCPLAYLLQTRTWTSSRSRAKIVSELCKNQLSQHRRNKVQALFLVAWGRRNVLYIRHSCFDRPRPVLLLLQGQGQRSVFIGSPDSTWQQPCGHINMRRCISKSTLLQKENSISIGTLNIQGPAVARGGPKGPKFPPNGQFPCHIRRHQSNPAACFKRKSSFNRKQKIAKHRSWTPNSGHRSLATGLILNHDTTAWLFAGRQIHTLICSSNLALEVLKVSSRK